MSDYPPEAQAAFAATEKAIRQNSRTFYFATAFLAPRARQAVRALYAFCRATDDLVDRDGATLEELARWRAQVHLPASKQADPMLMCWALVREKFGVDPRYEDELIDGVAMDVQPRLYPTWDDLSDYCYHVASTVGLLSIPILGLAKQATLDEARPFAIQLGIALQLTNILRDVGEDAGRGRIYLPLEDLTRFGLTLADIQAREVDERFAALMRFEINRARSFYRTALPGLAMLAPAARLGVGAAALLYQAILDEIEAIEYQVFTRRAHTSTWRKVMMMPGIMAAVNGIRRKDGRS
ncbi:MAG TPA: squalene/phytoene synthase family protein [Anaerolineaceae bacterium]|nr:squalene/phytoene synthase family protein [Anaerolineaceae bacterium]HPN51904.1 squalene/phytoene synthase family protein [Anaerolineaceae bacterium]